MRNLTASPAPLYDVQNPANTWRLRKGADFDFATGTTIPANGYLVVVNFNPQADPLSAQTFRDAFGTGATLVGPFSGSLDNAGESIELQKPDSPQPDGEIPYIVVERIDFDDVSPWPVSADGLGSSLQRRNESLYGNDPLNWIGENPTPGRGRVFDSDGDGMPDDWEQANNLDPRNSTDAAGDLDNDGISNLKEFQQGTNPGDGADPVRIRTAMVAPGGITLQFWAGAGRSYSVLVSDGDPAGAWRVLREYPAPASTTLIELNDAPSPAKVRFYRIVTPAIGAN